jgi:metallo-beta-lactamase family protein
MAVTVTFHGACGTVTGSCFEIKTSQTTVLIDCGMFQGTKTVKALNYGAFPFDPNAVAAVCVTHAHIDHCGLLPKLVRAGYAGPIVTTRETADLLSYVLPDSGHIQELEVERLNRRNRQRGQDQVEPIYTHDEAIRCLRHITPRSYDKWIDVAAGIRVRFWNAGHILGSASIEMLVNDKGSVDEAGSLRLLFSGDIGPGEKPFQGVPAAPKDIDYLLMESTYGDRLRRKRSQDQRRATLRREILDGLKAGGMILIPSFAIERTQELLSDLDILFDTAALPAVQVFVDSPLATRATEVFAKYVDRYSGPTDKSDLFKRPNLQFVADVEQSRRLGRLHGGAIILAGSGMCDAGRIRHHLKNYLSNSATTVLLVGYQAPGTLGRLLVDKAPMVRIQGEEIKVSARIRMLDEYSGHADQAGLAAWFKGRLPVKNTTFLIHGEDSARDSLSRILINEGQPSRSIAIPAMGETVRLTSTGAKTIRVRARIEPEAALAADWHNAYADATLSLRRKLEKLPSERARQTLLKKVRAALR